MHDDDRVLGVVPYIFWIQIVSDIFFSLLSLSLSPFRNGLCWKGRKMYFKKTRDSFPTIEIPLKFTNSRVGAANGR